MKRIILLVLLLAAQTHAGLFDNGDKERLRETQQQLNQQRQATGGWQIIAVVFGVGAIILFGVGTAIGSKTRKEVKDR